MKDKRKLFVYFSIIISFFIIVVLSLLYYNNIVAKKEQEEKVRLHKEKDKEMRKVLTKEYIVNYSKAVLDTYFESIDSISLLSFGTITVIKKTDFDFKRKEYYSTVYVSGNVEGKTKVPSISPYRFMFEDSIFDSEINSPDVTPEKLYISDVNNYHVYPMDDIVSYNMHQEQKKSNEELKKKMRNNHVNFLIDNVKVKFKKYEGESYIFESSQVLDPNQIVKAIKQIGDGKVVQFYMGKNHYADFVYSTNCIIYNESHRIYKVMEGEPKTVN